LCFTVVTQFPPFLSYDMQGWYCLPSLTQNVRLVNALPFLNGNLEVCMCIVLWCIESN
jgi:hypothetical protein